MCVWGGGGGGRGGGGGGVGRGGGVKQNVLSPNMREVFRFRFIPLTLRKHAYLNILKISPPKN